MVIATAAFVGATRVGDDVDRLERAETLSFQLEARIYEQALLEYRAAGSGVQAEGRHRNGWRRCARRSSPP